MSGGNLYIMCGLPFSKKSTLAKRLARDKNAALISLDEINASRGLSGGGYGEISEIEWKKSHESALALLRDHVQAKSNVVIDDTNCFRFLRDNYRQVVKPYDYNVVVVLVDTPHEEILRRIALNEVSRERHHVSSEVLADLASHFEWPDSDEGCLSSSLLYEG